MKSKSTTKPSKFAMPYIQNAANTLQSTVADNSAGLAQMSRDMQGYAGTLGSRIFGSNPLTDQAKAHASAVLGGTYLNGSPQLDNAVSLARSNAFDTVNSGFGRSGMAGGTTHGGALGRGIAQAEMGLRYNDLLTQQQRMDAMANNAGSINVSDLAALPLYGSLAGQGAAMPYLGANTLASGMAGLMGGYNTTTQKGSLAQMLLAGANNAASAYAGGG